MFVEINGNLKNISLAIVTIEKGEVVKDDVTSIYTLTYYTNQGSKLVEEFSTKEERDDKYNQINYIKKSGVLNG